MGWPWRTALVSLSMVFTGAAEALSAPATSTADQPEYAVNAITVTTPDWDRGGPDKVCVVWADAEGLGVGPAQLGGYHGLSLTLNLITPGGITLDQALTQAKTASPAAPEWLLSAVRAKSEAIAHACAADHPQPVVITKLTPGDRH